MKILKLFICVAFIFSDIAPLYAEIMFDQPMYQPAGAGSSFRSPQEIIADFQTSVDRIQREQEDLYGQIELKNKENAFLLRKINGLSTKLLELDHSLSKTSSQDSQTPSGQLAKITAEKELLLKKYNETLSQKVKLESEIKELVSERQNVEEKVESGVATLKEALNSSQEEIARQKAQIDTLVKEKESLEQDQRQVLQDRSAVQSRLKSLELQNREFKENAAEVASLRQSPLQQRVRELSDRVDELSEDLREKDRLIVQSKKGKSESLIDLKKQEKENEDLKKQIQLMSSTYRSAQEARAAKIVRLEAEIQQKQNDIKRLSSQNEQKQKATAVLDPEREALEQQIARLKESLRAEQTAFERKLEKGKAPFLLQIKALQKSLDEKTSDILKKNKDLDSLGSKSIALSKELDEMRKQKENLTGAVASLEKKAKKSSDDIRDPEKALGAQILSLKQELDRRDDQLEEESRRVNELEDQKKELAMSIESINREKDSLQRELESFQAQLKDDRSGTVDQDQDVRKDDEQKMAFLSAEIKELEEKLSEREKKIADQVKETNSQKEEMQATINSLKDELGKVRSSGVAGAVTQEKTIEHKDQIGKLTIEKLKLEKELTETLEERRQFESELMALKVKYDGLEADMPEKMRLARAPLEENIAKLKSQLDEQAKTLEDKNLLAVELKEKNQTLTSSLRKNTDERDDLRQEIGYLEDLLEKTKSEVAQLNGKKLSVPDRKFDAIKKELEEAKNALKDKDELINEIKDKNKELGQRLSVLEQDRSDAQRSAQKLNDQIAEMKKTSLNVTDDVDVRAKNVIDDLKSSLSDSKQALKIQENLVRTLNIKIADLGIEVKSLTDEGVQLRSSLASAKDEKVILENELSALQSKLDQASRELSERSESTPTDSSVIEKERDKAVAQLKEITQDRDALKKTLEASQQQQKTLQDEFLLVVQKHETEMFSLKDQKTKSDEQLDEALGRAATFEKTIAHLNVQLDEARARRSGKDKESQVQWQQKIDALNTDLKESKERSAQLERSLKDMREKNEQLNTIVKTSERSLSGKNKNSGVLESGQKELLAQAALFDKERQDFESRIKALTQQISKLQTERSSETTDVKSESAKKTAELDKKLADAVGEISVQEGTVEQMIVRQKSLEQQLSDALLAKSRAETSAKQAQSKEETLRKEFEAEKVRMKEDVLRFGNERDEQIIKVNELQNALKDAQKQSKSAVDQAREPLIKEIGQLKAQIKKNESKLEEVKVSNKQLDQTKDDLVKQLEASQFKQKDIQSKFVEWKKAISDKEIENRGAVVNVERELNAKIKAITSQLTESGKRIDELTTIKEDLERTDKSQKEKIAALEAQSVGKDRELLAQQSKFSEDKSVKDKSFEEQISKLTEELAVSRKAIADLTRSQGILQEDVKSRDTRVAQLEVDIEEKQTTIAALQDQSAGDLMTVKRTSENKITELTAELASSKDLVGQLTKDKNARELSLNEAQSKIEEMSKDVSERTSQWQKKFSDQEKALQVSAEQIRTPLIKEIDDLRKQTGENAAQIESLSAKNKEFNRTKEDLTKELSAAQSREKENQIKMAGVQEAMINKSTQDRQALISMEKDLKARIEEITSQLVASQAQAEKFSQSKQDLEKDLKSKEETIAKLEVEAIERKNTMSMVEAKAKEEIAVSKSAANGQFAQLNAKINDYERSVLDLTRSKESMEAALRSKEARIAEIGNEFSQKEKELAVQNKAADAQIQKMEADLQTARKSFDDLIKSRESLEDAVETKEAQIAGLQAQIVEKDKAALALKSQASSELTTVQNKLNRQMESLTAQLNEQKAASAELTKTKDAMEAELRATQTKLAQANSKATDKENQLAAAQNKLSGQIETLASQLNDEKELAAGLRKDKEIVETELKTSETQLAQAIADAVSKDSALKALEAELSSQIATAKKPLEEKIDILVKSLGDAQAEVKIKEGAVSGLNTKVSGLERSLNETITAKASVEKETVQAKAELEKTRKEMSFEIQKAGKLLMEKNQILQIGSDEKTKKITALTAERDRLSAESATLTEDRRKLQQDVTLLKQEIDKQKRALEDNEAVVKAPLLAQIAELQKTIDGKDLLIEQKAEAFAKVNAELTTVLKGLAVIREDRDTMSAMVKPLQEQIKTIPQEVALAKAPLEAENSRLNVELQKVQGMLDVRVKGLEADIERKTTDFQEAEAERRALKKEITRVSQSNNELSQDMEKLQLKLSKKFQEDCGVALQEIQKPWKDKIDQLKAEIEGKDKEIESFKNENLRLNQELGDVLNEVPAVR